MFFDLYYCVSPSSIVKLVSDDDLVTVTVYPVAPSGSHSYSLNIFSQLLISILI